MGLERTDFLDFVLSLNPIVFGYFGDGRLVDLSSYANVFNTQIATPKWLAGPKGYSVKCEETNSRILTPHIAAMYANPRTLFVSGYDFRLRSSAQYLINKADGGGRDYSFYLNAGTVLVYRDDALSQLAYDPAGARTLGVVAENGVVPRFFSDGVHVGNGNLASIFPTNGADFYVGCVVGATSPPEYGQETAILFPGRLSDEDMSDLHRLWLEVPPIGRAAPKKPYFFLQDAPDDVSATMTENFEMEFDSNGQVVGTKGVSVGTRTGLIYHAPGIVGGRALQANDNESSYIDCSNPANLVTPAAGAIEVWVTPINPTGNTYPVTAVCNTRTRIQNVAATFQWSGRKGNPQISVSSPVNSVYNNVPAHLILTWWTDAGTLYMEFFLDGRSQGTDTFTDTSACTQLRLFNLSTTSFFGKEHLTRTYSTRVTPADARLLYLQYAVKPTILSPRYEYPVTLANVAAAGNVGPWQWGSGTWAYADDGSRRRLVNVATGWCSHFSDQAFGGWYWRMKKVLDAANTFFLPIASMRGNWNDAAQNGYMVYFDSSERFRLSRISGGAATSLYTGSAGDIALGTEYEMFLARRSEDSQFSLFVRGGAYTSWTAVGTATDTTHTTSTYVIASAVNDDTLSDVIFFEQGGTIDPTAGDLDEVLEAA